MDTYLTRAVTHVGYKKFTVIGNRGIVAQQPMLGEFACFLADFCGNGVARIIIVSAKIDIVLVCKRP